MKDFMKTFTNGIIKENPIFRLLLGMCSTLALSTQAINGLGMGAAVTFVLVCSNVFVSMLRKIIPNTVRIPCYVVVIATFVTIVQMVMKAYLPALDKSMGVFIPLIVVNCVILGRAEAFANKNSVGLAAADGLGMGLGFTIALTFIGIVRELIGAGTAFGLQIMPASYEPVTIFILAPGAFFVLSCLVAAQNYVKARAAKKGKEVKKSGGCADGCANCSGGCGAKAE